MKNSKSKSVKKGIGKYPANGTSKNIAPIPITALLKIRIKPTEENKLILLSGYICNALQYGQIVEKKWLFEAVKRFLPIIKRKEFNSVLKLLNSSAAITGVTDKYIYQTTSAYRKQKTVKQIMTLLEQ